MGLPHRRRDARAPLAIAVSEPAVAIVVGMLRPVFPPQQHQRHAASTQLGMHPAPFRLRPRRPFVEPRWREHHRWRWHPTPQARSARGVPQLSRAGAQGASSALVVIWRKTRIYLGQRDPPGLTASQFNSLHHRSTLGQERSRIRFPCHTGCRIPNAIWYPLKREGPLTVTPRRPQ
jgi:hypothetical protein